MPDDENQNDTTDITRQHVSFSEDDDEPDKTPDITIDNGYDTDLEMDDESP